LGHAHDAVDLDNVVGLGADFLDEKGFQVVRGAGLDLQADDAATAALFQQDLEFADEAGLFLDLDIAVAKYSGEYVPQTQSGTACQEHGDDVLERNECRLLKPPGKFDESRPGSGSNQRAGTSRHHRACSAKPPKPWLGMNRNSEDGSIASGVGARRRSRKRLHSQSRSAR
jgi:hypothetical protein